MVGFDIFDSRTVINVTSGSIPASQLTQDQVDAIVNATPTANGANPFITSTNLRLYQGVYNNYTDLITNETAGQTGRLFYVINAEGTRWLPGSAGGTYRPKGAYVDTGTEFVSDKNNIAAALELLSNGGASLDLIDTIGGVDVNSIGGVNIIFDTIISNTGPFTYNNINGVITCNNTGRLLVSYLVNHRNQNNARKNILAGLIRVGDLAVFNVTQAGTYSRNLSNNLGTNMISGLSIPVTAGEQFNLTLARNGDAGACLTEANQTAMRLTFLGSI